MKRVKLYLGLIIATYRYGWGTSDISHLAIGDAVSQKTNVILYIR
ncbi:hypothetical protein [Cytobacillus stercorigallinarum]|nr:hypothetical protein [Cytobacillus stercorigallinarum]